MKLSRSTRWRLALGDLKATSTPFEIVVKDAASGVETGRGTLFQVPASAIGKQP